MTKKKYIDFSKLTLTERRMIEEIVSIKKREVNKIMIPTNEIVAFDFNKPLKDVLAAFRKYHYSRYPVFFNTMDQIVGIVYIKDVVPFWRECADYPVVEFVRFPHFVYEDRSALDVFLELQRLRLSLGIVIDEFGGVSGIITLEDIVEEIVGDIEDEFDKRKKPFIEKQTDSIFIVNTRMGIDDFAEYFDVSIDEDDVSTVSGLIIKNADRIPKVGEKIKYKNLLFEILEGTRRKISKARVILCK
jgi:CBS domain containing-hemolysin-like protein